LETPHAPGDAPSMRASPRPEVLAPAGDMECVRAAVEYGADAVYFGLPKFSARIRAENFTLETLPELLEFLRLRGVKAYIAFNTLVFSDELDEAASMLERVIAAGPDALILQDFGIARLARAISPDIELHASTQTTTTCAEQMAALEELGFSRVILARELTLKDIRKIAAATTMPLEVFVHGALCVAYSGQCLTSEALGGRSANRGACAQACRLPYDLIVDGKNFELGERKYLLSPQDLAAYDIVPELIDAGVRSFKIEGRLKTPEYVAATTRAYRKAVDEAWAQRRADWSRDEVLELQQVFSRGLSHGFLDRIDHQVLVPALSPKKRGPFLGRVTSIRAGRVGLTLENPLRTQDGVSFDYGSPDDETGGRVYEIRSRGRRVAEAMGGEVELSFGDIDWLKVHVGDRVWKTSDPALERRLRAGFETPRSKIAVKAVVSGAAGTPLELDLSDGTRRFAVRSDRPLEAARNRPLTADYLREQIGRLGTTPFELGELDVRLEGDVILPVSALNELRRQAAAGLEGLRRANPDKRILPGALDSIRPRSEATSPEAPELVVMARSMDQLRAALDEGVCHVEADFEDPRKYRDAVELARERGAWIALAPPRIFKPGESGILSLVLSCAPDAVLARNLVHIDYFRGKAGLIGDFSLNIANDLAADWFLRRGLDRFTPSHDLNVAQLEALLSRTPAHRAEVVIHQHMPMFHLEHCVFAATLSKGHDATDCGRPCDRHQVALKDRVGKSHALKADVGCRNTVFNAVPQSASPYIAGFRAKGVRWFRAEMLLESAEEAGRLIRGYRDVIGGRSDGQSLWRELRASNVVGVTRGPLGN
jgi:putative protease